MRESEKRGEQIKSVGRKDLDCSREGRRAVAPSNAGIEATSDVVSGEIGPRIGVRGKGAAGLAGSDQWTDFAAKSIVDFQASCIPYPQT